MGVIIFITSEQRLSYQESPFFFIISRGTTFTIHIHFNFVLFNPSVTGLGALYGPLILHMLPALVRCTDR